MAGTDQSVNLGGMLNNIAGTIGEGYQIGGKSAGEAMGGLIANSVKPTLNMEDPASLKQYASWARNNGREEEAMRYEAEASRLRKQQQSLQAMSAAGEVNNKGIAAAQGGDLTQLEMQRQAAVRGIQEAAANNDVAGAQQWQQTLKDLRTMGGAAQKQATINKAEGISRINGIIKSGVDGNGNKLPAEAIEAMKAKRTTMMEDSEAVSIYNAGLLEERKNIAFEEEQANKDAAAGFLGAATGKSIEEIDSLYDQVPDEQKPAVYAIRDRLIADVERNTARIEKAAANGTQIATPDAVADIQAQIDALPESASAVRAQAEAVLKAAEKRDASLFVNGTYSGVGRKTAEANWTRTSTAISGLLGNAAAATDAQERDRVQKAQAVMDRIDLARVSEVTGSDIRAMQATYGRDKDGNPLLSTEDAKDLIVRERNREYIEAEAIVDPARGEARLAAAEKGFDPDWNEKQTKLITHLASRNLQVAKLLQEEDGAARLVKQLVANGSPEWAEASAGYSDTETEAEKSSDTYAYGMNLTAMWEWMSEDNAKRGEAAAKTRRQRQGN